MERYGLTQEDVDIIGVIERNILDSMVCQTIDSTDSRFSNIMHSDNEFTFTIDEVIPKTYNNNGRPMTYRPFNLDMNLPKFLLKGSLMEYNKELENDQTWLDHVLDIMIEVVAESNPILKALGVNIDFDDYPVDYEEEEIDLSDDELMNESTIKSKRDKIDNLIVKLKKLYPKLDYCVGKDDTIQIYTYYDFNEESDIYYEKGTILEPIDPPSDFWRIGEFTDYREEETGEYVDRAVEMMDRSPEEKIIEWLDHDFGLGGKRWHGQEPNYYGYPHGWSAFDWRKCED